ncbi:MAG: TonB family protein [Candidatus Omnitrophica bacterium]|nr:TonB family protein [Candidatus Omnitrophota bacterium]
MKKILLASFLIVAGLIISPYINYASDEMDVTMPGEELKLYLGQVKFIPVSDPTRIVIGNPSIADVTNITKSEIILTPKAIGSTTFAFQDSSGEHSFQVRVCPEDMAETKRRIDNLLMKLNLPEVFSRGEDEEGKVLLLGRVELPQDKDKITLALGPLKDKTTDLIIVKEEDTIIEIAVEVMELDKGATNTLGFTWPGSFTLSTDQVAGGAYTGIPITRWGSLFTHMQYSRSVFEFKLDALIQEGKAKILSRPRLACQSGKEAELLVGGEKPIFTTTVAATTGASGTQVEYKDYGIKLKIKPTLTDENRIKVALNIEVSELESTTPETIGSSTAPTAKAYPLTRRTASTEVLLNDEQVLAIGGLVKQKTSEQLRKLPWFADIPLLGFAFRQRTTTKGSGYNAMGDTELFITLTPKIVNVKKEMPKKDEGEIEANPSPAPAAVNMSDAMQEYTSLIQNRILEQMIYPVAARDAGFQGTVKLALHISNQGELLDALVRSSSGHKVLDDDAIEVAKDISDYPPFPASSNLKELWVEIPIVYQLN